MADGPNPIAADRGEPAGNAPALSAPRADPRHLFSEAISLGLILATVLALAAFERRGLILGQGVASSLLLLTLCLLHRWRFRNPVAVLRSTTTERWRFLPFSVLLVAALWASVRHPLAPQYDQGLFLDGAARLPHLLFLVPVSEEFYFRGLLLDHLRRGLSAFWAVVLCSLLFGLLHLPVGGVLPATALSLLACILVFKTRTLNHAIQLHAAWNAFSQVHTVSDYHWRVVWAMTATLVISALSLFSLRRPSPLERIE